MSAQLFVVATPIGHLDDMTYRAIDVLKSVKIIAAEDTRTSAQLLKHFNIQTPLTACHEHNESNKIDILIQRLLNGEDMALISDAGTPLLNGFKGFGNFTSKTDRAVSTKDFSHVTDTV